MEVSLITRGSQHPMYPLSVRLRCLIPPHARGGVVLLCAWLLAGCSVYRVQEELPEFRHHGPVVESPEVDVLAVTPPMEDFLQRFVLPYKDPDTRLELLLTAIRDPAMLGFRYDDDLTLTAGEAFERRTGNCIGFANLMVALARRAGLEAEYQQVSLQPQWTSKEDTLLVAKHINVRVKTRRGVKVIDSSGLDSSLWRHTSPIEDAEGQALYYTNLGAEALIANDLYRAYAHFMRAIGIAPGLPDPWINLGVTYSRNGQPHGAELAYRTALAIDDTEYAALANLYEIYLANGEEARARELERRVERYRERNPYYLLVRSGDALAEARYEESFRLLERAIETKADEHLFHFALARTHFLAGDPEEARASLERARELAPASKVAHYNRPLAELVLEE